MCRQASRTLLWQNSCKLYPGAQDARIAIVGLRLRDEINNAAERGANAGTTRGVAAVVAIAGERLGVAIAGKHSGAVWRVRDGATRRRRRVSRSCRGRVVVARLAERLGLGDAHLPGLRLTCHGFRMPRGYVPEMIVFLTSFLRVVHGPLLGDL